MGEELRAKLGLDLSEFERGLNRAVRAANRVGGRIARSFGVMRRAARAVAKAVALISAATIGIGALAIREFVQWEAAMTGVAKTVDASVETIAELGRAFMELPANSRCAATAGSWPSWAPALTSGRSACSEGSRETRRSPPWPRQPCGPSTARSSSKR